MSVKSKLIVIPTVALALVVLTVGYTVLRPDDPEVVLHADFSRLDGNPTVSVQFSDTVPFVYPVEKNSWDRVTRVAPGVKVTMLVTQTAGGAANCAILIDGVPKHSNSMYGPGNMSCHHLVTVH